MDWFRGPTVTSILNRLTNYSHTAIGSVYAASALFYHIRTGRDLGGGFVTFSGYFYAFLLGHAGVYQKWPDRDAGPDCKSPGGPDVDPKT